MKNKIIILVMALSTFTSCGKSNDDSSLSIVKGKPLHESDPISKHIVALLHRKSGAQFCSGTLIGKQFVLTAAHCVQSGTPFVVAFGTDFTTLEKVKASTYRHVKNYVIAKTYAALNKDGEVSSEHINKARTVVADIALVKLANDAPQGYEPVKMLPQSVMIEKGYPLITAGYGITGTLKEGLKEITSFKDFIGDNGLLRSTTMRFHYVNQKGELVLYNPYHSGVCSGDSGGPVFYPIKSPKSGNTNYFQVGIASMANCYNSSKYTDIRVQADWIKSAVRYLNSKS